ELREERPARPLWKARFRAGSRSALPTPRELPLAPARSVGGGCGPPRLVVDPPLVDPAGEAALAGDLQAQGLGEDRGEGAGVVAVGLGAVVAGVLDLSPRAADLRHDPPGCGDAALAAAGVVEPVDLDAADLGRGGEVVLDPLARALPRPPVAVAVLLVGGGGGVELVGEVRGVGREGGGRDGAAG